MGNRKVVFNKGDKVRIKRGTRFSVQSNSVGIVHSIGEYSETDNSYWYDIEFPEHGSNSYTDKDIFLVEQRPAQVSLIDEPVPVININEDKIVIY